jgi:hypothetical protein
MKWVFKNRPYYGVSKGVPLMRTGTIVITVNFVPSPNWNGGFIDYSGGFEGGS